MLKKSPDLCDVFFLLFLKWYHITGMYWLSDTDNNNHKESATLFRQEVYMLSSLSLTLSPHHFSLQMSNNGIVGVFLG